MPLRLALAVPAVFLLAASSPSSRAKHPDAGANPAADACETCHAERTPAVMQEWDGGPHGLALVKCFVCHGSTGADFAKAPATARCEGCHPAEVRSVTSGNGKAQSCFGCHAPHTLAAAGTPSPHAK